MSDYDPAECLRQEVERFKRTNQFTPMEVTSFYVQAAIVLDQLKTVRDRNAELEALAESLRREVRRLEKNLYAIEEDEP